MQEGSLCFSRSVVCCTAQVLIDTSQTTARIIGAHSFTNHSPSLLKSLEAHRPWPEAACATPEQPRVPQENVKYVAWQIRTSEGESTDSFKPLVHTYIFDRVPSTEVCPWYFTATKEAIGACRLGSDGDVMPIFVSSNRSESKLVGVGRYRERPFLLYVCVGNGHTQIFQTLCR